MDSQPKKTSVGAVIVGVIFLGPIVLCSGCFMLAGVMRATTDTKKPAPAEPIPVADGGEYADITIGMTYNEVVGIIGTSGEEMVRSDVAGIVTVMYMWKNPLGSNASVTFQNGRATVKAQFGLPER